MITAPALNAPGHSEAEIFGSIVWLAMQANNKNRLPLQDLSQWLLPALRTQQFILASESIDGQTRPVAYMSWANLTAEATAFGVSLKPKMEIAKDVEAFARIGATHSKYEDDESSVSKTKLTYGIGMQAQFTKDVYGQVDYMNYYKQDGLSAKGFTVSVGTRF